MNGAFDVFAQSTWQSDRDRLIAIGIIILRYIKSHFTVVLCREQRLVRTLEQQLQIVFCRWVCHCWMWIVPESSISLAKCTFIATGNFRKNLIDLRVKSTRNECSHSVHWPSFYTKHMYSIWTANIIEAVVVFISFIVWMGNENRNQQLSNEWIHIIFFFDSIRKKWFGDLLLQQALRADRKHIKRQHFSSKIK